MTPASLLANILLAVAGLLYLLLVSQIYLKPMPRGDYGVGYAWMALFLNGGFLICIGLAALALGARGAFQWVRADGHGMGWVVMGVLSVAFVTAVSGMGANEGPLPIRMLMKLLAYLLPLLALAAGFGLANDTLAGGVPAHCVRRLSMGTWWIAMGAAAVFFLILLGSRMGYAHVLRSTSQSRSDDQQQETLNYIDTCDLRKDLVFLFVHTDINQPAPLREHALARIRTYPQWQQEMVRRLDSGWASEVFTFLASNPVDDPALFPEAVRRGILQQAKSIHQGLSSGNYQYYADSYCYEVKRLLQTVHKFKDMGVDYEPALRELRAVFPNSKAHPYRAVALIDNEMEEMKL